MAKPKGKSGKARAGTARREGSDTVVTNLKGVEGRRRRRPHIPEGNYLAKVVEAEAGESAAGDDMVTWVFEITDGDEAGQRFWYRNVLTTKALWNFRAVLEALGVKVKDSAMNIPLNRLVGRTCALEIVDGEYKNKTISEINDVFPEALLEEDEEDEDDVDFEDEDEEDEDDKDDEDEDENDEDEDEEDEFEDFLGVDDLKGMDLEELTDYAKEIGASTRKPRNAKLTKKVMRTRILERIESETEDEDEVDLDEEEL